MENALDPEVIASLQELDSSGEFLRELIGLFQSTGIPLFHQLEAAAAAKDGKKVSAIAHQLKSSAGNLGARRLSDLMNKLEGADCDEIAPLMVEAKAELQRVLAAFDLLTKKAA